ncbi:MAG: signal peptidase I, partial [Lentisphaerota bacterium]
AIAFVIAMVIRAFAFQAFKIPTGSMQPTLYGITVDPQIGKQWSDYVPVNLVKMALWGVQYQELHASVDGPLGARWMADDEFNTYFVGGVPQKCRRGLTLHVTPGSLVAKGQLLASGLVNFGDHIFVNKVKYNFLRPRRGDIIVFDTDRINYDRIRPNSFYIKRLVGLPGDEITVDPPYLVANGNKITEPYPFERLLKEKDKGYIGYRYADAAAQSILNHPGAVIHVGLDEFLPFGDNTAFSLDGRYFGPVKQASLVGPAFMIYWPFTKRWGFVQ